MWDHGWMMGYGSGSMGLFMGLFWLVVIGLIIWAVVAFVQANNSRADGTMSLSDQRPSGLSVLEERYARGEIDRDEYLQKKQDLSERS